MSTELLLLKVIVGYYTFASVVGLIVNVWALVDSNEDTGKLLKSGINGRIERIARMASRSAYASVVTHLVFLSLGIINLVEGGLPRGSVGNHIFAFAYSLVVCGLMTLIVYTQTFNQIDRIYVRNEYQEEMSNAER